MKTPEPKTLPADVQAAIVHGQAVFKGQRRFDTADVDFSNMTLSEKSQHYQDSMFNAWAAAAAEGPGQPPMVERFYAATRIIAWLESTGVRFGVGVDSRMNKALHKFLNDIAERSSDERRSRRKKITAQAVRALLKKLRRLRMLADHFTKFRPYSE
jgi:hypothetical protein